MSKEVAHFVGFVERAEPIAPPTFGKRRPQVTLSLLALLSKWLRRVSIASPTVSALIRTSGVGFRIMAKRNNAQELSALNTMGPRQSSDIEDVHTMHAHVT